MSKPLSLNALRLIPAACIIIATFLLQVKHAETLTCSLCPGGEKIADAFEGTTCGELEIEALSFDQSDVVCTSLYHIIGVSKCGCNPTNADSTLSKCDLCPSPTGNNGDTIPGNTFRRDSIYDSDSSITCEQVQSYLQSVPQSIESCDAVQYRGIVNCGCPRVILNEPKCNLCTDEKERVNNPETVVIETQWTEPDTTCGIMEYILGKDIENQYNNNRCSTIQDYLAILQCSCSEVPTTYAPNLASDSPSISATRSSNKPSNIHSFKPSVGPSTEASNAFSSSPTVSTGKTLPSRSSYPSPSTTTSPGPSHVPSFLPTLSNSDSPSSHQQTQNPSFAPSSITSIKRNCTALEHGIMPNIKDIAENDTFGIYYNLLFESKVENDLLVLESDLKKVFDRRISAIAARCTTDRKQPTVEEFPYVVHFVTLNSFSRLSQVECTNAAVIPQTTSEKEIPCIPMGLDMTVYFSNVTDSKDRRSLVVELDAEAYIYKIVESELPPLLKDFPGVHGGLVVGNFLDQSASTNESKYVAIGVGVGCSIVLVIVLGILMMQKGKSKSQESSSIMNERHIRSDDSISDNPTISSGRRAMIAGWDHDTLSEYSRRSSNLRADDISLETESKKAYPYESSYLPSSVLKDLLGDDGELSLDQNDTFDL